MLNSISSCGDSFDVFSEQASASLGYNALMEKSDKRIQVKYLTIGDFIPIHFAIPGSHHLMFHWPKKYTFKSISFRREKSRNVEMAGDGLRDEKQNGSEKSQNTMFDAKATIEPISQTSDNTDQTAAYSKFPPFVGPFFKVEKFFKLTKICF